jgi:alkylation response protein AidB-like acyl-CoA dehydrogenase
MSAGGMPMTGPMTDQPLNFDEPDHVRMLRETTRRFVEAEMPRAKAREWDRGNIYPADVIAKLGAIGMMGLTVEERYGGAGIDIYATMAVIEEIAKRSVAVACPYIMAVCYAGMNIGESASEEQKQELLPKVAAGNLLFAYGLSEPNVGGDLAMVETTARREGDDLIINGTKRWCTGAHIADYIFCLLRTGPKEDKYRNLSIVLVPPSLPGITITPLGHLGIRGVETKDVVFEDVRVPASNILGGEAMWNKGWSQLAGRALEVEKLELSACALGLAEAALADAWVYAEERVQFGRAIAEHQAIRHTLAEAQTKVRAMRLMLYSAAWLADQGRPCSVETSMAKLFCCEGAAEVTQMCLRVTGAYGLSDQMDMERYMRDAVSLPIVGGSSAMQKNNIANRLKLGA